MIKRGIMDVVNAHDGVKGTSIPNMAKLNVLHVIWRCIHLCGRCKHLVGWHVDEVGKGVDKAANQPGTSNAINLGMLARHPFI